MQTNILEAKNNLSRLIKSAEAGEDVVIAKRGKPVARLVALTGNASVQAKPGSAKAVLAWLETHRLPAYARRTPEEIEADIRDARESWD